MHEATSRRARPAAALTALALVVGAGLAHEAAATSPPADTAASTGSAALTDSYRGVTADSIKIGVLLIDAEKLLENTGVVLNWGDNQGQYQEAIDALNESGGVLGRQIDPVFVFVDPLSPTGYEEACVQLTQDEQVFAVVGFTRPADEALCYAATGDTPFVGYLSDITGDVFARSELPIITSNALPERTDRALVDVVADSGALDGKTIAVIGNSDDRNANVTDDVDGAEVSKRPRPR